MQVLFIVLLMCTCIQVTHSRPIKIDSLYEFWKSIDKQWIPQIQGLQKLTSMTIESFCETDEISEIIPSEQSCDEYIQTLAKPVDAVAKHIHNPNKFIKALIKNTIRSLGDDVRRVQLFADEYSGQFEENCQNEDSCMQLKKLSSSLNKLKTSIDDKTQQYFQIRMQKPTKDISINDKRLIEKVAILSDLFSQLKETESALEFIMDITWEVNIPQITGFRKKKRRKTSPKDLNLGL